MKLFLSRIPPETKVAAGVLGAALLQVGLLAWLGLQTTDQRRSELESDLRARTRAVVERSVINAGMARIAAFEQRAEREIEPDGRGVAARVADALVRAPLYEAGFLVTIAEDGSPRLHDHVRAPIVAAPKTPRDDDARARLRELEALADQEPEHVLTGSEELAAATGDLVVRALALQLGGRAAWKLGNEAKALELASRVTGDELRAVVDDRDFARESAPFGLGAAAVVCEIRRRALERAGVATAEEHQGAFVRAVADRRVQAQRMRDLLGSAAYAVEKEECTALVDSVRMLVPTRRLDALRAEFARCDAIDARLDRIRAADAVVLARTIAERQAVRLPVEGGMLTVLPIPASASASADAGPTACRAVALLASDAALQGAVLEPLRQGIDLPDGVAVVVRTGDGSIVEGSAEGEGLLEPTAFGAAVPGLSVAAMLADPEVLHRQTESARRLWMWILGAAVLAVVAASLLAVRAVMREVRLARLKGDFVSNLSHELRTPLTSLRMFVETLQEGRVRDEEERRQCLDFIAQETGRLATLVDRILQFASFSRGRAPIELQSADLGDVARRAIEIFRSRSEPAGAKIELQIQASLPEALLDRAAMIQVVLNLLDNAVKYGGEDGAVIRVVVRGDGPRVRIEVEDDGPGVPERERELVFEEFYRGDESLSSAVQGAGIGLALCRRIVLAHGGRIDVSRGRTLGGASFAVTLPEAAVGRRIAVAARAGRA